MDLPQVTVVLAVLNAETTLRAQLDALADQTYPGWWEVVVADNGCTDGSMAIVEDARDRFCALRAIDASARPGDAYPKNRAVDAASGEIVVSCDADDVVQPGWMEALVDELADCDIAYGIGDVEALNEAVVNRWHWSPRAGNLRVGLGGGNIGCWRTVWQAMGGWDEDLFCADIDFRLRAEDAGCRIGVTPDARILIRQRTTLAGLVRRSFVGGTGIADVAARHPRWAARDPGVTRRRAVEHLGFVLLAWPVALVSSGTRGVWLRIAAFNLGRAWAWLRVKGRARQPARPEPVDAPAGVGEATLVSAASRSRARRPRSRS